MKILRDGTKTFEKFLDKLARFEKEIEIWKHILKKFN